MLTTVLWLIVPWRFWCWGERRSRCSRWKKSKISSPVTVSVWLGVLSTQLPGSLLIPAVVLAGEALYTRLTAFLFLLLLCWLPGTSALFSDSPPTFHCTCSSWAGTQRVGGVAAPGFMPGPLSHLSVPAKEWLHRSRTNRTPNVLLCVCQEAEEEEQAVSSLQAAHPVGHPHLPQLRRPSALTFSLLSPTSTDAFNRAH